MHRFAFIALALLAACSASPAPRAQAPRADETRLTDDLFVRPLAPTVLLHLSWTTLPPWGRISSNGVVVLGEHEALLVDTAWNDSQTATLLDYVEREYHRRVTHLVVTHAHDDRVGGIRAALARGVIVHELALTAERSVAQGYPPPSETFQGELALAYDGIRAEAFFPGAAHAPDNIVVYLPEQRMLVGGCMIREASATSIGNLSDASLATWIDAVSAVRSRFPDASVVIPGHGAVGDAALFARTEALVREAAR